MTLLKWALLFLVVAVIAGILGLSNIAEAAELTSRILFAVFLIAKININRLGTMPNSPP